MRTKKIRLGIVMAAMSAVVGGSALGAAQAATAWAETGVTGSQAIVDSASSGVSAQSQGHVAELSSLVFDWQ